MAEQLLSSLSDPSVYERNFSRLVELLPTLASVADTHFLLAHDSSRKIAVEIIERHKFTLVIRLSQALPLSLGPASSTVMTVRIYFDAKVAEVLAYQHHRRFQPKYDYPNVDMLHVREKRRVNEFLGEWLASSLAQRRRVLATV